MTTNNEVGSTDNPPVVERRRARLPQPDFGPYKKANAYPGAAYFFVGHSYNLDSAADTHKDDRVQAISKLFDTDRQWISVQTALGDETLARFLSRFEHDLLSRLPESALIGPAINSAGKIIGESFTIWRKEMRRAQTQA
ncbi:MAG TPA: hypothetical protein V6C97_09215 [Oculatellaceae cyanobacterium]